MSVPIPNAVMSHAEVRAMIDAIADHLADDAGDLLPVPAHQRAVDLKTALWIVRILRRASYAVCKKPAS